MRRSNVATHAGSRTPERKAKPVSNRRTGLREWEDPNHPGLHTVSVPTENPNQNAGDLINAYKTLHVGENGIMEGGYHVIEGATSQVPGCVLMGIDIEEYHRREDERANGPTGHNTLLKMPDTTDRYGVRRFKDLPTRNDGQRTKIWYDEDASGTQVGEHQVQSKGLTNTDLLDNA